MNIQLHLDQVSELRMRNTLINVHILAALGGSIT